MIYVILLVIGIAVSAWIDNVCYKRYGYCSLAVGIYKLKHSKYSWLACNVIGNDDWFYERMHKKLNNVT